MKLRISADMPCSALGSWESRLAVLPDRQVDVARGTPTLFAAPLGQEGRRQPFIQAIYLRRVLGDRVVVGAVEGGANSGC